MQSTLILSDFTYVEPKATDGRVQLGGRNAVVYEGARGGKYVKKRGTFVPLKTALSEEKQKAKAAAAKPKAKAAAAKPKAKAAAAKTKKLKATRIEELRSALEDKLNDEITTSDDLRKFGPYDRGQFISRIKRYATTIKAKISYNNIKGDFYLYKECIVSITKIDNSVMFTTETEIVFYVKPIFNVLSQAKIQVHGYDR